MLRPRTADELDLNQGGGMVYRQGPHQIDTVRVLGGGMLRSVRANVGQWMPERPVPGYYTAFLEFENGVPVTIAHNGYGYFHGLRDGDLGTPEPAVHPGPAAASSQRDAPRRRNEAQDKQDIRIGGRLERQIFRGAHQSARPWVPEDLGLVIVSCERGDLRHSPMGIYVYNDEGQREIDLDPGRFMGGAGQRRAELEEFYRAIVEDKPLWHDGRWGLATLEVVLAIIESAKTQKEVKLTRQIPLPVDYDSDFTL